MDLSILLSLAGTVAATLGSLLATAAGRGLQRRHRDDLEDDFLQHAEDRSLTNMGNRPTGGPVSLYTQLVGGVVIAIIGAVAVLGSAYMGRARPDCVAYADELQKLDTAYSDAQLQRALQHLRFGDYEIECGSARDIVRELGKKP